MKSFGVIVCLVAIAAQVFAEEPLGYIEDARSVSGARIVSGWDAEEGQIPWQLSLRMVSPVGAVSSCGGSIIHPDWGMTAAHCTATRVTMVLRAGAVSLLRPELLFETTEYFNHPWYNSNLPSVVQPHDIAILKFQRTITFSDRVQPIRLQRSVEMNRNYDGVRLEASGWGRTWTNGATPENLQWVYLLGDSNQRCWSAFGGSSIVVDSTICASAYNVSSQSTCQGDSGGPLVELEEDGQYTIVGVTSFVSAAGCHADFPAGFIRPGHYHDWITQITGINFDWVPEKPTTTEAATTTTEATTTTTEATSTTEADSSSESSESSESSSSSEESEETTTEAESEEAESEEATTEAESEEATTEAESEEATTEAESEETTTEATSEEATTENESEEATTETESEEGTTEAESEEATKEAESEEGTTEAESEEGTTEAESEEATKEAESEEATTETESEEGTTEAESEEATKEAESEEGTTEAASEEATTEAESKEATTEAESEEATTEAASAEEEEDNEEKETRSFFSYFRGLRAFAGY